MKVWKGVDAVGVVGKPNILFIIVDQMRADCTGYAAHPVVRTPNLDALASRGVWYANAFSPSPLCVPARAELLTGRWCHETANRWGNDSWRYRPEGGIRDNGVILDPDVSTLPELLTLAGYHTAAIGKCHYAPRRAPYGFAHRVNGQATGRHMEQDDSYLEFLKESGYGHLHMDSFGVPPEGYNARWDGESRTPRVLPYVTELPAELQFTRWCADRAIDFIEREASSSAGSGGSSAARGAPSPRARPIESSAAPGDAGAPGRPFFLQVGFHAPHDPYCVSRPYDRLYDPADMRLPVAATEAVRELPSFRFSGDAYSKSAVFGDPQRYAVPSSAGAAGEPRRDELSEVEIRRNWCYYLANITFIDEQVGRLLATLEERGLAKKTMVIFTSDHGDHMGDHGLYGKSTFWDESIRVPLVVGPAGRLEEGTVQGAASDGAASQGAAVREHAGGGRVDELVTLMDLFPTVLHLAGAPVPNDLRDAEALPKGTRIGRAGVGTGGEDAQVAPGNSLGRRFVFGELGEGDRLRYMVRSQTHKYIVHPAYGAEELYDLAADPHEQHNLAIEPEGADGESRSGAESLAQLRGAHEQWKVKGAAHLHPRVPGM